MDLLSGSTASSGSGKFMGGDSSKINGVGATASNISSVAGSSSAASSFVKKSGSNELNIQSISTLQGGDINFSLAQKATNAGSTGTSYNVPLDQGCGNNSAFEKNIGKIVRTCDVTKGEWNNDTTSNCVLKRCSNVIAIGSGLTQTLTKSSLSTKISYASVEGVSAGASNYYVKSSGYTGAIKLINSVASGSGETVVGGTTQSYSGFEYRGGCPTGYYCQGCENNQYVATCDLNSSNSDAEPRWTVKGKCVPIGCKISELTNACNSGNCSVGSVKSSFTESSSVLGGKGVYFSGSGTDSAKRKGY
ncbi:MAG: hypothetical protein K2O54_02165, partial [Prevotella sp.]|nr:hypothetical protein [Prevotella sp.]